MEESNKGVIVDIFGSEYIIKGDGNSEYTKEVAGYVDLKMREISAVTANVSSLKLAILTALNMADEVYRLRKEKEIKDNLDIKVDALVKVLEGQGF